MPLTADLQRYDVPNLAQVALRFAQARVSRTVGLEGLPPAAFRAASWELARAYYLLIVKAHLHLRPPLQWRGGALVELPKQIGLTKECKDFRDIIIMDFVASAFTGMLWPGLLSAAPALASSEPKSRALLSRRAPQQPKCIGYTCGARVRS